MTLLLALALWLLGSLPLGVLVGKWLATLPNHDVESQVPHG
jgi:glycerol-3-phosphate acyltransferase PlsY